ncbi:MAG TPA: hypothetical protein VFL96_02010 [Acidobacteriaceae bacterium]|nr:hypothetical protein [Acidobacteriaceae bacterium]
MKQDKAAEHYNGLPEQGRAIILGIALVKRSPKADWDKLGRPVQDKLRSKLSPDEAAHQAATSPKSDLPLPTEAQKEAGNFQKGHTKIGGLDIAVEHPEGAVRSGRDDKGNQWMAKVRGAHYGYLKQTNGADDEHLDVFVKPGTSSDMDEKAPVFVVDQVDPKTRKFDEHKVLVGYGSGQEARQAYMSNFPKGWNGFGRITRMSLSEFKNWLKSGNTSKPIIRGA